MDRDPFLEVDTALGMDEAELRLRASEARQKRETAEWPDPEPLTATDDEPAPFPLEALPPDVGEAVAEYQAYGGQPVPMVACSALGAMSLPVQGLVDVRRESRLVGPVSLNIAVIADSGERKTGCDRAFTAAAERWAREEIKRLAPEIAKAREARDAHEAEKAGLLAALRETSAGKGKYKDPTSREADAAGLKRRLQEHGARLPPLPPIPTPMIEDGTAEGLGNALRNLWPSSSWWSAEGGNVTGGHGFKDDALVRTLAFLNSRWDGGSFDRARAAETYTRTHGRRLTVAVMLQPAAFVAFARAGNGMARGLGALARFLIAWPPSTMGSRLRHLDEDDPDLSALGRFLARAEELHRLRLPMPFDLERMTVEPDDKGRPPPDPLELTPAELPLDSLARRLWIEYLNECERQLVPEGELATVRDVAAKSAENACRLAAIFHVWRYGPHGSISADDMVRGIEVARWFLYEARRVLGSVADQADTADAELLARWVASCTEPPTLKDALRRGPYRLRSKVRRDAALDILTDRDWLRQEKRDGKTVLNINPKLQRED